jgi:hypothetical protein
MDQEMAIARQQDAALAAMTDRTLGPPELDHSALAPVHLVSRVLFDGDSVSSTPFSLLAVDDVLIASDIRSELRLYLFDTASGRRLKSFGPKGVGPGEYRQNPGLAPAPNPPRTFWTYSAHRLTQHALDATSPREPPPVVRTILLQQLSDANGGAALLDGSTLISTQIGGDASVARLDSVGRVTELAGPYADWAAGLAGGKAVRPDGRDADGFVPGAAFNSRRCISPNGRHFAIAYVNASRIELWDGTFRLQLAAVPFQYLPPIERDPESGKRGFVSQSPNIRLAYISCAATDAHVYAVFIGRLKSGDKDRGDLIAGRFVHVFTWAGALVQVFQLDHDAEGIAVAADGRSIYTVHWHGERPNRRSEGRIRKATLPPM